MRVLRSLLLLAYPAIVYLGLQGLEPRTLALAWAGVFLLRGGTRAGVLGREGWGAFVVPALLVGSVLILAAWRNEEQFLLLVPALMNAALLLAFGRTLLGEGPPLVESLARLQVPDLPAEEVDYCRSVTRLWCAFFAANAGVSLWLALRGDTGLWAAYTGGVAYLLVGLLFGAEFLVRSKRFGRYHGTWVEPLFRRLFPHEGAS